MSNIQYERHTKAQIDPTVSTFQLAAALLSTSELEQFNRTQHRMIIEGKIVSIGNVGTKLLLRHLKEESVVSGAVKFETFGSFHFSAACSLIVKKYGLSGLHVIGTRDNITGFIVSSVVTISNPDEQVKKYATIVRAIKQKYPDRKFELEECQQTMACDPKLTDLLKKLLEDKQPRSSLYPIQWKKDE